MKEFKHDQAFFPLAGLTKPKVLIGGNRYLDSGYQPFLFRLAFRFSGSVHGHIERCVTPVI